MRRMLFVLLLLAIASILPIGAFAMSSNESIELQGDASYSFTVDANAEYGIYCFPVGNASVSAKLWEGNTCIADGQGINKLFSLRLVVETEYRLDLDIEGTIRLEITRQSKARCFEDPLPLDADRLSYTKKIVNGGDVHWYSVQLPEGQSGFFTCVSEDALPMNVECYNADGQCISVADQTDNGTAFTVLMSPVYLRVFADGSETGAYTLSITPTESKTLPEALTLSAKEIHLNGRESVSLTATISLINAIKCIYWESADPEIAQVNQNGRVTGGSAAGTTTVTAYCAGGLSAQCRVTTDSVWVEDVQFYSDTIELNVGDDASLEWDILPENATNSTVYFSVHPETLAQISEDGILKALSEGTGTVTVSTSDGDYKDTMELIVHPAVKRYRALLIGEWSYGSGKRNGSSTAVSALETVLSTFEDHYSRYSVNKKLDLSRDQIVSEIESTFAEATEQDVSLIYLTSHGEYADGMTRFLLYDGSVLTAVELEEALHSVPGTVYVFLDCCYSGGAIGVYNTTDAVLSGIAKCFEGISGGNTFSSARYRVMASAAAEQESCRLGPENPQNDEIDESKWCTVFALALCEGAGWDVANQKQIPMRADINEDGQLTMNEWFEYTRKRVMSRLSAVGNSDGEETGLIQTVCVWPEGCMDVAFVRSQN